jgi:hypothetical protein
VTKGSLRRTRSAVRLGAAGAACALIALASAGAAPAAPRAIAPPPLTRSTPDALADALAAGRITQAQYALERAVSLFDLARVRARFGEVARPDPRDATLILRDLRARLPELAPSDRATARRLLARPTDGSADWGGDGYAVGPRYFRRSCTTRYCVHWVTRSADAPSLIDRNGNGVPDWVDRTKAVLGTVWATEVGRYGYHRPLSDANSSAHHGGNPNGKLDVFLADVGADNLYGYCTSDDPRAGRQVSAYCVLDDDFSRRQYTSGASGLGALKVTAAHEFFHAVQFAYDVYEDGWLMEGTATWIEDEVYDGINDNRQFLPASPLGTRPWLPLDMFNPNLRNQYGVWVFFRYLSERFDRSVVRDAWSRAVGRSQYSVKAVVQAVEARAVDFDTEFADFGMRNVQPAVYYSEGRSYRTPKISGTVALAAGEGYTSSSIPMYHFSNDYYSFVPESAAATLTVTVKTARPLASAQASALVFQKNVAAATTVRAVYDAVADQLVFPPLAFGSAQITKVVLVLTNPSTTMTSCWTDSTSPWYACRGRPADDVGYVFTAQAS